LFILEWKNIVEHLVWKKDIVRNLHLHKNSFLFSFINSDCLIVDYLIISNYLVRKHNNSFSLTMKGLFELFKYERLK
jgi:hypothetical protein